MKHRLSDPVSVLQSFNQPWQGNVIAGVSQLTGGQRWDVEDLGARYSQRNQRGMNLTVLIIFLKKKKKKSYVMLCANRLNHSVDLWDPYK